jgi:hypothetical protein
MTRGKLPALLVLVLFLFCGISGCVTYSFGTASYDGEALHMQVNNAGSPREVVLQVTVFETTDFKQEELFKQADYMFLENGENEYVVPVALEPGEYKLFLYVTVDGARTVCEIRDIMV